LMNIQTWDSGEIVLTVENQSTRRKKPVPVPRILHQVAKKALVSGKRLEKQPAAP